VVLFICVNRRRLLIPRDLVRLLSSAALSQIDLNCKWKEMSGRLPVIPYDHSGEGCNIDEIEGLDDEPQTALRMTQNC